MRDVEVEVEVCQPVRAKANSPWREPWEEGEINEPRQGRKNHFGFASLDPDRLLPPLSGLPIRRQDPIAHAMGYYLAPLPGLTVRILAVAYRYARLCSIGARSGSFHIWEIGDSGYNLGV